MSPRPTGPELRALFGERAQVAIATDEASVALATLHRQEEVAVVEAVPKRRLEFARGRAAAREALAALGIPPAPIPVGPAREPIWPPGIVGSITHCEGFVAAAVARASDLATLGLDAEPATPLPPETRSLILLPAERSTDPIAEKLVFSAKESIYKGAFPLTRAWIDFHEVEVTVRLDTGIFTAVYRGADERIRPLVALMRGRFLRTAEHLVTASYLRAGDLPSN